MRKLILLIFISFSGLCLKAQTNLDSLYTIWQDETQPDSNRTKAYSDYIWDGFLYSNPDTAFILAQSLLSFSEKQPYVKAKSSAYHLMGLSLYFQSDYPKALEYFQRSLKISEEIGDVKGSASPINNIGVIYQEQGAYTKALEYFQRSIKISEEIGDIEGSAGIIGNIGIIYKIQGDYTKALDYFQRSMKIFKESGDIRASATAIVNIGITYQEQEDYLKALDYYAQSLKIYEDFGDKRGSAGVIINIGTIYGIQEDYPKALDYFNRCLNISEEMGDVKRSADAIMNIGIIYKEQGDYTKALEYCKKALVIFEDIGALGKQKATCHCLYDAYKAMGKGNEALVYLEKAQVLDDSLNAEETTKKLQQMEFQKQVLQDSIDTAEKARIVQLAHEEDVQYKNLTRNYLAGIGLFLLLLAVGFYSRWRHVRKSKASLQIEKDCSENLLLNILPADIAKELKEKGKADARDFDMVSILFTDFKGFTAVSEKLSAQELVAEINTCFKDFDGIMGKYSIEKIKTIGDAYMAAGGLPIPADDSVKNTVLAALEMQAFITSRKTEMDTKSLPAFEMRVGIHTGPVVAGIVGVKKFAYDIWGDTVNTASRMESSGGVGQVNISQATYELLKDDSDFSFESRGKIEAKGKGEIEMYFVRLKTEKE